MKQNQCDENCSSTICELEFGGGSEATWTTGSASSGDSVGDQGGSRMCFTLSFVTSALTH